MKYYGTKNNKDFGFYEEKFDNAVEISDEYWTQLLEEQCTGKLIIPFENTVLAVNQDEYEKRDGRWVALNKDEIAAKKQKRQNDERVCEIYQELEELDKKRIRAIAEPSMMDDETSWLEYYNKKIKTLRDELGQLNR